MEKLVFKTKNLREKAVKSNVIDALLFGLGRTLQELLGTRSGYAALRSIGYNMLEYLEKAGVKIAVEADPVKTIANLCSYYVQEGLAERIEIEQKRHELCLVIHNTLGSGAFNRLCAIYGKKTHVRPSSLLAMVLAALARTGYEIRLKSLDYVSEKNIWRLGLKLKKIEFNQLL